MEDFSREHDTLLKNTKDALSICLDDHKESCPPYPIKAVKFLPTRLLDLESVDRPRLVSTSEIEIQDRRYVPLSHQWGTPNEAEKRSMTTTVSSLESRTSGFELKTLPSRYQTVIMLCYAMGIRYVWIDSLCIIQDSAQDWELQFPTMAMVYECGVFTVCSNLPAGDVPYVTPDLVQWALKLWKGGANAPWLSEVIGRGPLSKRAWCLQERQLSPRILHVYHNQTWVWECNTRVRGYSMSGPIYPADVVDSSLNWRKIDFQKTQSSGQRDLLHAWDAIVTDYTQRKLTYATDKMHAISAVAQKLQPLLDLSYLNGLWQSDVYGLLWHCDNFIKLKDSSWSPSTNILRPENSSVLAPSWSWGSVDDSTYLPGTITSTEKTLGPLYKGAGALWLSVWPTVARGEFSATSKVFAASADSKPTQSLPVDRESWTITLSCHSFRDHNAHLWFRHQSSLTKVSFDRRRLAYVYPLATSDSQAAVRFKNLQEKTIKSGVIFLLLGYHHSVGRGYTLFGLMVWPSIVPGVFVRIGVFKFSWALAKGVDKATAEDFREKFGDKSEFTLI